jgi:hypothetical protein
MESRAWPVVAGDHRRGGGVKRWYKVGDRFTETTPSGYTRRWTVIEDDAEPKYPQPSDRPYLRMRDERGQECVMSERVILAVDWIVPRSAEGPTAEEAA